MTGKGSNKAAIIVACTPAAQSLWSLRWVLAELGIGTEEAGHTGQGMTTALTNAAPPKLLRHHEKAIAPYLEGQRQPDAAQECGRYFFRTSLPTLVRVMPDRQTMLMPPGALNLVNPENPRFSL